MFSNDSCVLFVGVGGGASACVCVCVHARVRVPMFSNDSCTGLGCDSGVSGAILGNMITYS